MGYGLTYLLTHSLTHLVIGEYKNIFYAQCLIAESIVLERQDNVKDSMVLIKRSIFIVTKSKFEDNAAKVMKTFFFAALHYCRYLIPSNNAMAYKIILLGNALPCSLTSTYYYSLTYLHTHTLSNTN